MKRSVKILWRLFFVGFATVVLLLLFANFGVLGKMPSVKELENPEADLASEIISADGQRMGKFYSENRSEVKYQDISPNAINALIATEDERFYEHSGIDAQALARVLFTAGSQGGGSTITQQLAKMMLGQGRGNVMKRGLDKLKEWIVAVKLERNFTKEEIITLYLNRAPWLNIYGIRNASLTYFQKEPSKLKIEEAAVLIGMLKGSSIYEPIRHPKNAVDRRNTVINQMAAAQQHFISKEEAEVLKAKPLITNYKSIDEEIGIAPYFRRALLDNLKDWCKNNINNKTGEPYNLYRDGLKVYTTIDSRMQAYAEEAVENHMPVVQKKLDNYFKIRKNLWKGHDDIVANAMKQSERWKTMKADEIDEAIIRSTFEKPVRMKIFSWTGNAKHEKDTVMTPNDSIRYHKQLLQTSFVAMDPRTGEVKAWVGGINYKWFKFDHVTAQRQVGSTFKPLLYTLAVTDAGYTPDTQIPGGALALGGKTISGNGGTMANCLAFSKNIAAWRLMAIIGVSRTLEFARNCGISAPLPPYPSIALGAADIPMLQMLQAFTMFPNKGYNTAPVFLTRIEDKNGNLIHEFPIAQSKQVIGETDAYTMVKMMMGVVKIGTARRVNSYNIPVEIAGKTGTTNANTDGWFIGYTPELLAGTWVGAGDPFIPIYTSNAGGAEMSAPNWGMFMSSVYADKKIPLARIKQFEEPAEFMNNPVYADATFDNITLRGDSLSERIGNGDASDFLGNYEDENPYMVDTPKPKKSIPVDNKPAADKPLPGKPEADKTTPVKQDAKKNDKNEPKVVMPPAGKNNEEKKKSNN